MYDNSMILDGTTPSRRDSRKRRRLSERRRMFSRLGLNSGDASFMMTSTGSTVGTSRRTSGAFGPRKSSRFEENLFQQSTTMDLDSDNFPFRSDSPTALFGGGDQSGKISMKIQFHITVAPDNEPLILDPASSLASAIIDPSLLNISSSDSPSTAPPTSSKQELINRKKSTDSVISIGDQIHEKLTRQNTASTRRRQQLVAMHNQAALSTTTATDNNNSQTKHRDRVNSCTIDVNGHSEDNLALRAVATSSMNKRPSNSLSGGREVGARSSTISGGMQDEATLRFLARHQMRTAPSGGGGGSLGAVNSSGTSLSAGQVPPTSLSNLRQQQNQREHIYFKRDGQRFGHEFTLKLAVDKNYRCLLKVRPLIPLQAISIQGHHVAFVDCSTNPGANLSSSAPASSASLNYSSSQSTLMGSRNNHRNSILNGTNLNVKPNQPYNNNNNNYSSPNHHNQRHFTSNHHYHRLSHAQTTALAHDSRRPSSGISNTLDNNNSLLTLEHPLGIRNMLSNNDTMSSLSAANARQLQQQLLRQQQHNQMMRHFAASHCSPSGSHLGSQLIYMFDWSAGRFEVNKNKDRTQVHTVLKFKNGQILSLPLQVKFYQPESKQHLNWGSQLHFIDYDCNINNMGQIKVDRIQYY